MPPKIKRLAAAVYDSLCARCKDKVNGVPLPPRGRPREVDRKQVCAMHAKGMRPAAIAREFDVAKSTITRILARD